jgi:hypothetical protein
MTTEENNPEGSRVVAMLETIKDCTEIIKDLRTELRLGFAQIGAQMAARDADMKALLQALTESTSKLTTVDQTEKLTNAMRPRVCARCSASPPLTSPPTSTSNTRATLYFTRLQIIETQVPAVEQRVRNVDMSWGHGSG